MATPVRYEQSPLKIDYSDKNLVRMNLNENIVMPLSRIRSIIAKCADLLDTRFYTSELGEGEMLTLTEEIARYSGCSKHSVGIGSGSDQVLDLILRMKLDTDQRRIVTVDPSYSMYPVLASRLGAKLDYVKLEPSTDYNPFSLDTQRLIKASRNAQIVVLASPNNPTGIQYPMEDIQTIAESLPDVAIIIDEAYLEYARYSAAKLLSKHRNLLIARTFSKAFGMANLRLGYLISSDVEFIEKYTNDFQYPYPVGGFAVLMAIELLRRKSMIIEYAEKTKIYRLELEQSLTKLGFTVIPKSDANFVLLKSRDSRAIAENLLQKYAIAVKYIPKLGVEGQFIRITVGSREINEKLLYSLKRIISK
ncbi:MAG: histidinol-phosphate aminotransferase family protein [Nitrososphaerota archaeon]|nr:histidinol-phosphate aminotransferase family protein [Nitrososphaerota archaeon]